MRFAKVCCSGEQFYCRAEGDRLIRVLGDVFSYGDDTGEVYCEKDVKFLPPVMPTKIVAIGKNYREHADEMKEGAPEEPLIFLKPNTCVIGNGDNITYPSISKRLDYEGELGVVIGKSCRNVCEEKALDYVLGYTCANDVTARDIQKSDMQWTRGKSFDTFFPMGPYIVVGISANNLRITTRLNGVIKQDSVTSRMTHGIGKLISYISRVMTLLPGDIISTGTPAGIGPMDVGDIVEVEIEQIGKLTNQVTAE